MSNQFESYEIKTSLLGSFLEARYPNSNPEDIQIAYNGTAGSVVVLVRR